MLSRDWSTKIIITFNTSAETKKIASVPIVHDNIIKKYLIKSEKFVDITIVAPITYNKI